MMDGKKISVIIPTLNAASDIEKLLLALYAQSCAPDEIIVVDSESVDNTTDIVREFDGVHLLSVRKADFDHGKTRDMALCESQGDFVLFLTQDALPADEHYIENLLAPFEDPLVAAAGGRQVAKNDARSYERLMREENYPSESRVWGAEQREDLGIRAFLISDACAAYRREAYIAVGGFDYPILTNEDMLIAERFLRNGYKLAYCGDAMVYHSHNFTFRQQYKRNYIVGMTLEKYKDRFDANETGEGMKLALKILARLLKEMKFFDCFGFAMDCFARFAGNRMGKYDERKGK